MGIAMKFYVFTIMGLIFMIIGLANKKKWREFEGK
jgi:ABC-type multidrug transport system permease subunit